jgi:thiol-disulfide isomerase/thioredoxin
MRSIRFVLPLVLAWLMLSCGSPEPKGPSIQVVDLKGLQSALDSYRGQAVLLNFWAIWCQPCVAELPELLEVAREFRGRGGVVLGVSYDLMVPGTTRDEVMKQMEAYVAQHKIDIPILIYDASDYDSINERFGLPGPIPVTLALDRAGSIVDRQEAQANKARFTAMMQKALGK